MSEQTGVIMPGDPTSKADRNSVTSAPRSAFTAPQLALPKGGGALRGISETFAANLVTGTGALTVPIPLTPGRSGSGPQLSLSYDSGGGNGPFGFGWRLSLAAITRRTDKGLPRYDDAPHMAVTRTTDIFLLSGAEDLVPVLERSPEGGGWRIVDEQNRDGYAIQAYRPRTEGLFARIERWTRLVDGDCHWRSISRDNVLTVYGLDANSRIADPDDPTRVFTWLIARSYDDRGEAIAYDYAAEDDCVDLARPSERRRARTANRYLRRIRWGNREPQMLDPKRPSFRPGHLEAADPDGASWMFSALLDYGEGRYEASPPDEHGRVFVRATNAAQHAWHGRPDPFSSYRSGFEVRTHRLCRRVLMFHHFPDELGVEACLVKSTGFFYRERPFGSFLEHVEQCGHKRQPDGRYLTRALPQLDLAYTASPLEDGEFHDFVAQQMDEAGLADLPGGVDGGAYRWLDLDGEGISGVLAELGGAWVYKSNLGDGRLGAMETVPVRPAPAGVTTRWQHLMDVDGDGFVDLLDLSPMTPGYYGRNVHAEWEPFRTFRTMPVMDWNDSDLRFIDLTGDGIADVLITRDGAFEWRPSQLGDGYGVAQRAHVPTEEEESGARLLLADALETIFLADMTGDGLTDLVRVRNGEVCYWPNRGYGAFGAKVTMDRAPWFDEPDQFEPRRIRLADVDGSGCADLIYLARDGARIYVNEAGNGWSGLRRIGGWPTTDSTAAVDVADLLGRGTACLVWSSPLPREAGRQIRYIDLMRGQKPHLLCRIEDNMGATTRIEYASSTEFYLADKAAGAPWITRLPIPVYVVSRVEKWDAISRNRIVSRYSYHHGYYDGLEREFRGFGRVDQLDTEDIASLTGSAAGQEAANWDVASSVPPVLTKTWFHTGIFIDGEHISRRMAHEYFYDRPPSEGADWLDRRGRIPLIIDTALPPGLAPFEAREACRALKGSMLRQEIYARDGAAVERTPYLVEEHNFTIVTVQPIGRNRYASFFSHPRESITVHYERNAADPRIGHELTLAVDAYGNLLKSASIGYARRAPGHEEQAKALATLTENLFTNAVLLPDAHRTPMPAAQSVYQLTAPEIARAPPPLRFGVVEAVAARATAIPYVATPTQGRSEKRLVSGARTLYRADDLERLLLDGEAQALALPGESFTLALNRELLASFAEKAPEAELASLLTTREAGYRDLDGDGTIWIPSGRLFYAPEPHAAAPDELAFAVRHFFLPHRYRDPFGHDTVVGYDAPFNLAPVMTRDAAGNVTRTELDYRVLTPRRIIDPNGNRAEARFDVLGLLAGTVLSGKADGPVEGDSFEDFVADLSPAEIACYFAARDPRELAHAALGTATSRFLYDFALLPACAASIARETHVSGLAPGLRSRLQLRFVYADGFGREAQTRSQAEPGPLDLADPEAGEASPRWVASGAKIYNNKGKPVRQYEPFFSAAPQFGIERWGVSAILFYDPPERVVATLHPNKTWEKVVFDPWSQIAYDVNDTATFDPAADGDVGGYVRRLPQSDYLPTWYEQRAGGALGPHEQDAARKAARDADTPTRTHFDVLGRVFLSIADNGTGPGGEKLLYPTRTVLDIKGARLAVIDALDRVVMREDYDLNGAKLRERSMEAGARWMLQDATGKPLRNWNSRGYAFRMEYDELHRPRKSFVRGGEPDAHEQVFPHEILFEETVYGDSARTGLSGAEREARNLRAKVFAHFDGAGVVHTDRYDFKGNSLTSARRFTRDFVAPPDWSRVVAMEDERFDSESVYDALNRAIAVTAPDGSVYRPTFNDANLLERVEVNLRGAERQGERIWTPFIDFINYDAKGERTVIAYGNGARTTYRYDPDTFRLIRLETARPGREEREAARIFHDPELVQDLRYTYDPVGNITRIEDRALRTVFHAGRKVNAASDYSYDPLYRLMAATGREHKAQSALSFAPPDGNYRDFPFVGAAHLHDLEALRRYVERYDYDPVGNIRCMEHKAEGGGWTRTFEYEEPSQLEPERASNRLSRTATGSGPATLIERYRHDVHGNMTEMPHLPVMAWDFHDQLCVSSRQVAERGERELTRYVYDGAGERARKITLRPDGERRRERLYVGGFELYREYEAAGAVEIERQTLHVMDDVRRIALVETLTIEDARAAETLAPRTRFQFANQLGSSCIEFDGAGGLITYEEYSPYGCTTFQAGIDGAEVTRKRYRYTAKERDTESGFTYHGARYYAPWLGRWIACDPASLSDGPDLYRYSHNNPVRLSDSSGMAPGDPTDEPMKAATKAAAERLKTVTAEISKYESAIPTLEAKVQNLADRLRTAREVLGNLEKSKSSGISGWIEKRGMISGQKDIVASLEKELEQATRQLMVDVPNKIEALKQEALEQEAFLEKPESAAAEADRTLRGQGKKPGGGGEGGGEGGGGEGGGGGGGPSGRGAAGSSQSKPGEGGKSPAGGEGIPGTPSASLTILDALGALGAANLIVTAITGKDPLGNFYDYVRGGLRIDPEARLQFGDVLQITPEDRRAAAAQNIKRQIDTTVKQYAKAHGVSEAEARRRLVQATHQGPSYPEIGPAP
jgi:RHS repeat-associated protein